MQLSNAGLQLIIKREGVILHTYKDSVGVLTIGTGHTTAAGPPKVVPGMTITKADNDVILRRDLAPIIKQVNDTVKVPITQNQFDALVSIIFNVGPKFLTSTCMKKLNKKDYKGAAEAIMLWNKPSEIIGRRRTERDQFLAPDTKHANAAAGGIIAGGAVAATQVHNWLHVAEIASVTILGALAIYLLVKWYKNRKITNVPVVK